MSEQSEPRLISQEFHTVLERQMQEQIRAGVYATYALAQLDKAAFYSDPYDEEISLEEGITPSIMRNIARTSLLLCDLEQPLLPHFSPEFLDTALYRVDPDTLLPTGLDSPVIVSFHPPHRLRVPFKPFSEAQVSLISEHIAEHAPFMHESPLANGSLAGEQLL